MTMISHEGKPCLFACGRESTKSGEHVIPQWLLKDMRVWGRDPEGPKEQFGALVNGEAVVDDEGNTFKSKKPIEYTAPCCRPCNQKLSRGFEQRKEEILSFLDGEIPTDPTFVGKWLLKSVLLFIHPDTVDSSPRSQLDVELLPRDVDLYSWMTSKERQSPEFLSLWAAQPSDEKPEPNRYVPTGAQYLPTWNWESVVDVKTGAVLIGIRNVDLRLAFHPGFKVEKPVKSCSQMWPDPAGSSLPKVESDEAQTWSYPFVCNHATVSLSTESKGPLEEPMAATREGDKRRIDGRVVSSYSNSLSR